MEEGSSGRTASLFPLQASIGKSEEVRGKEWLACSSFVPQVHQEEKNPGVEEFLKKAVDLFSSSSDEDDSSFGSPERKANRAKKRKASRKHKTSHKKRKTGKHGERQKSDLDKILDIERRAAKYGRSDRRSHLEGLQGVDLGSKENYFFDAKGDLDNVIYEGLYRMDIPAYRRFGCAIQSHGRFQDAERAELARYFSAKNVARERSRKLRRVRMQRSEREAEGKLGIPLPSILSIDNGEEQVQEKESDEQYAMRRTKEFNIATRERPFDLQLWVSFANFQDDVAKLTRRKGMEKSTAEKKVAILERALSFHPGSEELLLALLRCAGHLEDTEKMQRRWEGVLQKLPGSYRVWSAYINWQKAQFSSFSVPSIQNLYARALKSLSIERTRRTVVAVSDDSVHGIETDLVRIALESVLFDFQSGHTEQGVGKIQCLLEWHFFRPVSPLPTELGQLLSTFEKFWTSTEPRVGEEGGKGWRNSKQFRLEGDLRDGSSKDDKGEAGEKLERGGWSGWMEIFENRNEDLEKTLELDKGDGSEVESGSDGASEALDLDETEEELMEKLGMKLEEDIAKLENQKEISPEVLNSWLLEEETRQRDQFQPIHEGDSAQEDVDFDQIVELDDVSEWMFELQSEEARDSLLYGCLSLLGAETDGVSSNTPVMDSLNEMNDTIGKNMASFLFSCDKQGKVDWDYVQERFSMSGFCRGEGRMGFVARVLECLVDGPFKNSVCLCEAWLEVEVACAKLKAGGDVSIQEVSRKLLETRREHLPLWVAYGKLEAHQNKWKASRKVFDMAMAFMSSMQVRAHSIKPLAVQSYVDMEIAKNGQDSTARALHILLWLGMGEAYTPYSSKTISANINEENAVLARRTFQDKIMQAVGVQGGALDASLFAWVVCGATFELLYNEDAMGIEGMCNILRNVWDAVDPEVRKRSWWHEALQIRLTSTLVRESQQASRTFISPKRAHEAIVDALKVYPNSIPLLDLLKQFEVRSYTVSRLMHHMHQQCTINACTLNFVAALRIESMSATRNGQLATVIERGLKLDWVARNPMLWLVYLFLELQRGAQDSAKRVMLRAVRACPWVMGLWLGGLSGLCGYLSAREARDFIDLMKDKGLKTRTDVYEILLNTLDMELE